MIINNINDLIVELFPTQKLLRNANDFFRSVFWRQSINVEEQTALIDDNWLRVSLNRIILFFVWFGDYRVKIRHFKFFKRENN